MVTEKDLGKQVWFYDDFLGDFDSGILKDYRRNGGLLDTCVILMNKYKKDHCCLSKNLYSSKMDMFKGIINSNKERYEEINSKMINKLHDCLSYLYIDTEKKFKLIEDFYDKKFVYFVYKTTIRFGLSYGFDQILDFKDNIIWQCKNKEHNNCFHTYEEAYAHLVRKLKEKLYGN